MNLDQPNDKAKAREAVGEDFGVPELDAQGFLDDFHAWNPAIAEWFAADEQLTLTAAHWEILHLLRAYYARFDSSPAMRALVKYAKLELGRDKGRSIYLLRLFPGSPARIASRIAGLPKPANCL